MSQSHRVLVVGGGPAGLATAITLAAAGVAVVVVEKGSWPLDKVCGEGILPTGVDFLQRFGVLPRLQAGMFRPFRGIRYRDHKGVLVEADFRSGHGLGVRRVALSRALFESVRDDPLVELLPHTRLVDFTQDSRGVDATLASEPPPSQVQSKETFSFLIGADGLRSQVRRLAGLRGQSPGKQQRWGVRQHFAIAPWSPYVEVWWQRGIEAYITPSGSRQVEIAFLWDRAQFSPSREQRISAFLSPFPELAAQVKQAIPLSSFRALGPLAVASTSPVAGRVLLVGDALLYLDGLTGEGISLSFAQSELLAKHLPRYLEADQLSNESLKTPLRSSYQEHVGVSQNDAPRALPQQTPLAPHPESACTVEVPTRLPALSGGHYGSAGIPATAVDYHPTIGMGDPESATTTFVVELSRTPRIGASNGRRGSHQRRQPRQPLPNANQRRFLPRGTGVAKRRQRPSQGGSGSALASLTLPPLIDPRTR